MVREPDATPDCGAGLAVLVNAGAVTGKSRIAIITGFSLAHNPRALKEAMTLCRAGYDVVVFGAEFERNGLEVDKALASRHGFRFESVGSLTATGMLDQTWSYWCRFRSRLGRDLFRITGFENRYQLGYFIPELLHQAIAAAADYYIIHLEQALWVGAQLLRSGKRVGIDMEDWFSEDLLPETRATRPLRLLRTLEAAMLRGAAHSSCPSHAMSIALAAEFGCRPPTVLYNAFEWSERNSLDSMLTDRRDRRVPSIHWYSQTLGHGRGLEDLLAALPHVKHQAEIHLRGKLVEGFKEWLMTQLSETWRARVFIHDLVPNDELLARIAEHDIGFAGEMKYCRSRDLTVTNKILQYLLAGLAVVASDTEGQSEVASLAPDAVHLYSSGRAEDLAAQLNRLLGSADILNVSKRAALQAAEATFCWERQRSRLIEAVRSTLTSEKCLDRR